MVPVIQMLWTGAYKTTSPWPPVGNNVGPTSVMMPMLPTSVVLELIALIFRGPSFHVGFADVTDDFINQLHSFGLGGWKEDNHLISSQRR